MINFNFDKIYQWDQGLYLDVNTSGMVEESGAYYVHYSKVGSCDVLSVLVEDGKAAIPNILTQTPRAFIAYAYFLNDDLEKTLVSRQFAVTARPKPPEYIYEPTPVISYPELVQLVEDLRALQARLANVSAEAETLETGEPATAEVVMHADGLRFIFGLPRGEKGEPAVVDPTLSHAGEAADAKATGDAVRNLQQNKVNKVAGKGLSTNDFTNDAKKATDFVNDHFSSGSEATYFESGEAEDTVISAQRDIILSPAGSESGGVYLSLHDEDTQIMTAADVRQKIAQAEFSKLSIVGNYEGEPDSSIEFELQLPNEGDVDRARIRLEVIDNLLAQYGTGFIFCNGSKLVFDDGFDLQASVLLWSNPDQAAGMDNDTTVTLTLPGIGARHFKNLLVEFAMTSTSTERYTMVIPNETYTAAQRRYNAVVDYSAFNATATPRGRQIKACVKDRSLTFGSGYQGGEINNARMVPIRIFGLR